MIQFGDRVSQSATYRTGSPNYVDISAGLPAAGAVGFSAAATAMSWADGDRLDVLVYKDDDNWQVWEASWDGTGSTVELVSVGASVGSLADADTVSVMTTLTAALAGSMMRDPELIEESGAARTLAAGDHGRTIRCTSASAVTVTTAEALPVGFHCLLVQEGAGEVSVAPGGADTLNGAAASIALAGQYKSGYLYQASEGAWILVS